MNKDLPKWVQAAIVLVIAAVALLVFSSQDRIHVYGTYLRERSPHITTNLPALSVETDETMLRKHFEGVPLTCIGQCPGNDALGERVCYASIDKADGDAALTMAAFFSQGQACACHCANALVGARILGTPFHRAVWTAVQCRVSFSPRRSSPALVHAEWLCRIQS